MGQAGVRAEPPPSPTPSAATAPIPQPPASQQIPELIWAAVLSCPGLRRGWGGGLAGLWGKGPPHREQDFWSSRHTGRSQNVTLSVCLGALPFWLLWEGAHQLESQSSQSQLGDQETRRLASLSFGHRAGKTYRGLVHRRLP